MVLMKRPRCLWCIRTCRFKPEEYFSRAFVFPARIPLAGGLFASACSTCAICMQLHAACMCTQHALLSIVIGECSLVRACAFMQHALFSFLIWNAAGFTGSSRARSASPVGFFLSSLYVHAPHADAACKSLLHARHVHLHAACTARSMHGICTYMHGTCMWHVLHAACTACALACTACAGLHLHAACAACAPACSIHRMCICMQHARACTILCTCMHGMCTCMHHAWHVHLHAACMHLHAACTACAATCTACALACSMQGMYTCMQHSRHVHLHARHVHLHVACKACTPACSIHGMCTYMHGMRTCM